MPTPKKIALTNKIRWAFQKKEELGVKILILVGGRGSTKSTGAADVVLAKTQAGERWCCAREFLNSIEDSCHALLTEEIERIGFEGFTINATNMNHTSGGAVFHKGLARNPLSVKSIVADGIWIEEGENLGEKTIDVLSASFRISAAKKEKARLAGKEAKVPDIIITMNRGSSKDPISKEYLKPAEADISRQGYYHDEDVLIVEVNYTDMSKEWYMSSGLESERLRDERLMDQAEYDHKWHGKYRDTIENAIIKPEWFDACVDAHIKLGFKPLGQQKLAYDPADVGDDPEAIAYMHGSVVIEAMNADVKAIDEATDWATSYANSKQVDVFTWDCDGMGIGLKRQVSDAFKGKKVTTEQFKGSQEAYEPEQVYEPIDSEQKKPKTNKESFSNQRAQFYWLLRDRIFKTWQAVTKGKYINPDELISFSNDILHLDLLRAELCSVPRKYIASGRVQLMTKADMVKKEIASPNIGDCVMMLMKPVDTEEYKPIKLKRKGWGQS